MQRSTRLLAFSTTVTALVVGVAACSAKSSPPGPTTGAKQAAAPAQGCLQGSSPASSNTITISNFTFLQCPDTVSPGATITVNNKDVATHTLTATSPAGAFNTGDIAPGGTKTFTAPTKAGKYYYICQIHTYMTGVLIVK